MDDLWDDLEPVGEVDGAALACPSCGSGMEPDARVCVSCGYNPQSGQAIKTRTLDLKSKKNRGGSKAASIGVAAGGLALKPILPLLGAIIGGLIGAGVWALISYQFNVEIGWIAIGVGVLCGIGAAMGAGGEGGVITGGMAALVALGSISLGKYAAVNWAVDDFVQSVMSYEITLDDVDEQWALQSLVDEICEERNERGESVGFDNPRLALDGASWPEDYPQSVRDAVHDKWDSFDLLEKQAYKIGIAEKFEDVSARDIDEDWALSSMAYMYCESLIENDEPIGWDNPDELAMFTSVWPEDYPQSIRDETLARWEGMGDAGQLSYREELIEIDRQSRMQLASQSQTFVEESFIESFMHPLDLLFMVLAVGAAFKIGSSSE